MGNLREVLDTDLDAIYRIGTAWPTGPGSVKVQYKAGYSTVPADLKLAVIDLVTYYHMQLFLGT